MHGIKFEKEVSDGKRQNQREARGSRLEVLKGNVSWSLPGQKESGIGVDRKQKRNTMNRVLKERLGYLWFICAGGGKKSRLKESPRITRGIFGTGKFLRRKPAIDMEGTVTPCT